MARSGTSLSSSIFARKGYFIGEDFSAPDRLNPTGYWEAKELVEKNAALIMSTGYPRDNSWIYEPMSSAQLSAFESITLGDAERALVRRFNASAPWVWKDPRLCLLLRAWWPLFDKDNTAVLLVERDKDAIFKSFVRAGWRNDTEESKADVYERIELHISSAKQCIADLGIPCLTINYADFEADPLGTAQKIAATFQLDITERELGYESALNHHSSVGRLGTRLDGIATSLPKPIRRLLKALFPTRVMKILYPERYRYEQPD
jgi:hypothetical protein